MSSSTTIARHRAEVRRTANFTALAHAVTENAGGMGRQAAVIAAASGLVLTSGVSANAAELSVDRESVTSALEVQAAPAPVQAPAEATVSFNKTAVTAIAAPAVVEAPVVELAAETVEPAPLETPAVAEAESPAVAEAETPAVSEEESPAIIEAADSEPAVAVDAVVAASVAPASDSKPAPEASSGVAATIAAAAQGQLGVIQDCTRLVSNALAAAGINFHGWPAGYLSLGPTVGAGEAIPGDLIYYADGGMGAAHIAVYIGSGQAVHGGFNGNQTVVAPANLGSGPVFIRVGG
ncbi:NlpC/P60 family protein [Arthrobacter sp. H5]|uniref:NlpC/P60 family protein n=1 Tax=Arthrobacter sp. H5 TaxID=1267973 RepID=UPI00048150CB|nr:NlpC/P60 family protein [Arthrobacter sp. H5]